MRVDDRDALAGHEPAGDRLRAAARHRDDPPRRGPRAPAAGADGRRHHLDRRRHQARLHVRRAGRPGPRRVGGRVPQRAPRPASASARGCCTRGWPTRRSATRERGVPRRASRPRSPSSPRRPRTRSTSTAPRGCSAEHRFQDLSADQRADDDARAPRRAARRAARRARRARRARAHRQRERGCPRCARSRSSPPATACRRASSGTVSRDRPGAHGLRAARSHRARGRARSSRASSRTSTRHERHDAPRSLRGPRRRARRRRDRRSRRRSASSRASCTPTSTRTTPTPRRSSRRPPRPTRSSPTPSAARRTTATATRACAAAACGPNFEGFGSISRPLRRVLRRRRRVRRLRRRARRPARRAATSPSAPRSTLAAGGGRRASVEVAYEAVERCEHCHGNGAEPGTPIETCERCGGAGRAAGGHAHAVRPGRARDGVRRLRRRGQGRRGAVRALRRPRARGAARARCASTCPAGIADGQRIRLAGRGHAGERGGPPGDLYVLVRVARRRALPARRRRPRHRRSTCPAPLAALGATLEVADARRRRSRSRSRPARSRARSIIAARRRACRALRRRGRRGDLRVVVNVVDPAPADREQRELLERARRTRSPTRTCAPTSALRRQAQARLLRRVIRLALRVRREDAEIALAELLELAPGGRRGGRPRRRRRVRGLRRARRAARAARPARRRPAARSSRSRRREVADDWAERWREFHQPVDGRRAGCACARRGTTPRGRRSSELVIDPGQAFGTGAHATTRLCLELLLELEPGGRAASTSAAARACSRSPPRKLGWAPVLGVDHEAESRRRRRATTRAANGVDVDGAPLRPAARRPGARRADRRSPTCCARCCCASRATASPAPPPRALIASGLLAHEADEVAAAFAAPRPARARPPRRRRVGRAAARAAGPIGSRPWPGMS